MFRFGGRLQSSDAATPSTADKESTESLAASQIAASQNRVDTADVSQQPAAEDLTVEEQKLSHLVASTHIQPDSHTPPATTTTSTMMVNTGGAPNASGVDNVDGLVGVVPQRTRSVHPSANAQPLLQQDAKRTNLMRLHEEMEEEGGDAPAMASSTSTTSSSNQKAGSDLERGSPLGTAEEDGSEADQDEEAGSEIMEESDSQDESDLWIPWFCSIPGHGYLLEVDQSFIEDEFNLTGLAETCTSQYYSEAIDAMLDMELNGYSEAELHEISAVAEQLYLQIHQRFALSRAGQMAMYERYTSGSFGTCPRVLCDNQALVPVGISDQPNVDHIKLFCIRCADIYNPSSKQYRGLDGCSYGKTAAHLLFQTFPELRPLVSEEKRPFTTSPANGSLYIPKIFGFRVHPRATSGPKMRWLRRELAPGDVVDENEDHLHARAVALRATLGSSQSLADNTTNNNSMEQDDEGEVL